MEFTSKNFKFNISEGATFDLKDEEVIKCLVLSNGLSTSWIFTENEPDDYLHKFNKENSSIEVYRDKWEGRYGSQNWVLVKTIKLSSRQVDLLKAFVYFISTCYPEIRINSSILEAFEEVL